jgi:protein gp37
MSQDSAIEWTEVTWNPVTGCDRVSPGCDHCYAATLAKRLKAMGNLRYQNDGSRKTSGPGFGVTLHPDKLDEPLKWRRSRTVFVNSMSDLFHADVPDDFIADVFAVMALAPQHTFQVLTKRPRRMQHLLSSPWWHEFIQDRAVDATANDREPEPRLPNLPLPNVWLGVSVENQEWANKRIPLLISTPAHVRFLSCEPLIEPVDLGPFMNDDFMGGDLEDFIQWVIVGGESGPGARPMNPDWAHLLRDQCVANGIAFFFKQWGGRTPKAGGRELGSRTWDEMPSPPAADAVGVSQEVGTRVAAGRIL